MTTQQENMPAGKFRLSNLILILGLGVLLCGEAYFGYRLHSLSRQQEQIKKDYSIPGNITFGVFSVDQWGDRISEIVDQQVNDFKMTPAQKKDLQNEVTQALNGVVDKTIAGFNKPQKSLMGKLKKAAFNSMVNADDIHAQVPSFAKTIINKVNSPASQKRLKGIATSKIDELVDQTYDNTTKVDSEVTSVLYKKYHVADADTFNKQVSKELASIRTLTYDYAYAMLGCVVVALCLWWLMRKQVHLQTTLFAMSLLFAAIMLIVGITASIIEVDARVKTLSLLLMGQKVTFTNQVLFFQSKSIWGIAESLIRQSKPDAVVVGVLIMLFVIVLPLVRMLAKGIHIISTKKIAENKVVKYLAFESGKWDMADVMVVGILMTYIGLNGILQSQLSNLNVNTGSMTVVTENGTSLQPGYFIFVGYVAFALLLSRILIRITPHEIKQNVQNNVEAV